MPDPTLAYQSYQDAKKRGDELEAVRLWVEYLDAVRGDMKEAPIESDNEVYSNG